MVLFKAIPTMWQGTPTDVAYRISDALTWLSDNKILVTGGCIMFDDEEDYVMFKLKFDDLLEY